MARVPRGARVEDLHEVALGLPQATATGALDARPAYQVGGKTFAFFRGPRADAVDAETGERLTDVLCFWVPDEAAKQALVEDPSTPFFTTPHWHGYNAVLLRESRLGELSRDELTEVVQDAWLARAPRRLAKEWLAGREL